MSKNIYTGLDITGQSGDTNSLLVDNTSLAVSKDIGNVSMGTATPDTASTLTVRALGVSANQRIQTWETTSGGDRAFLNEGAGWGWNVDDSSNNTAFGIHYIGVSDTNPGLAFLQNGTSTGVLSNFLARLQRNGTTAQFDLFDGSGAVNVSIPATANQITYFNNGGDVAIGQASATSKLFVKSDGSTNTTDALIVQNSSSTTLLHIEDGGDIGINTNNPSAYLHVVGSTTDGDEAFRVDAGGGTGINAIVVKRRSTQDWTGIATATVSGAESLRVGGNALFDLRIGLNGNAPTSQGGISTPLNTNLAAYGGVKTLWHETTDGVHMQSVGAFKINFDVSSGNKFMQMDGTGANVNSTNLYGKPTTGGDPINEVEINLNSEYWDGSATAEKEATILHNVTASPEGKSQFDFSISGDTIISFLDTGNVGVGTTTPTDLLHVAGDVRIDGTTATTASAGIGGPLPSDPVGFLQININGVDYKVPFYLE